MEVESLSDFLAWEPPPLVPIMDYNLLVDQTKMIIYGPFGIGKSILCNQICFHIAGGLKLLNLIQCYPTGVWSIQLELPKRMQKFRTDKYCASNNIKGKALPNTLFLTTDYYLKMDTDAGLAVIESYLCDMPGVKVLIFDPLYKLLTGSISDQQDMLKFCDRIDILINRYHVSVIIVTHTRKKVATGREGTVDLGAEEILGSVILPGWADTIIGLKPVGTDECELHFNKVRHAEQYIPPVKVTLDRDHIRFKMI